MTTLPTAPLVSETYLAELEAVAEDRADDTGPQPTVQEIEAVLADLNAETTVTDPTGEEASHE